jgi:uncharacterized protein YjiS (DUF1127 family)
MKTQDSRVAKQSDRLENTSLLRRLIEAVRLYRRRSRAIRELQRLPDWQLRDIGIGRADIAAVVDRLLSGDQVRVPTSATVMKMPQKQVQAANDHDRQTGLAA